jgi:hypothetical protein
VCLRIVSIDIAKHHNAPHAFSSPSGLGGAALSLEIDKYAAREWRHPITAAAVRFGLSTIERWYLPGSQGAARSGRRAAPRKVRTDAGQQASMSDGTPGAARQYAARKSWSV